MNLSSLAHELKQADFPSVAWCVNSLILYRLPTLKSSRAYTLEFCTSTFTLQPPWWSGHGPWRTHVSEGRTHVYSKAREHQSVNGDEKAKVDAVFRNHLKMSQTESKSVD